MWSDESHGDQSDDPIEDTGGRLGSRGRVSWKWRGAAANRSLSYREAVSFKGRYRIPTTVAGHGWIMDFRHLSFSVSSVPHWVQPLHGLSTWIYYRKSGKDLNAALAPPMTILNAMAYIHDHPTCSTFTRDAAGNITGVTVSATGHAQGSSTATGGGSFTFTPPPQYDRQHEQPPSQTQEDRDA